MFITALFTIARTWKQPKCPSTDEGIKKMWHTYTMEYYSAIKRNETGAFVETWIYLETVIQSEVSQKEKDKYPEKTKIQKESCTKMFIAALFTIAWRWKEPKRPSLDEWIKKMWHIYTMVYYSGLKRNETELFVMRWIDLESVIQSEVSQKEKDKYRMLTHIYGI